MLKDVIKELCSQLNIERIELTANVSSDVMVIYVAKDKVESYPNPMFRKVDEAKKREGILRMSRARTKDERIRAVLDAHPNMTFKEWFEKEYPDKNYMAALGYIHNHPEMSIRNCIDNSGKRND